MLFHDFVFTAEQDRYLQEEIDWLFSEVVFSPLSVIDVIDKHVPQVCSLIRINIILYTCLTHANCL